MCDSSGFSDLLSKRRKPMNGPPAKTSAYFWLHAAWMLLVSFLAAWILLWQCGVKTTGGSMLDGGQFTFVSLLIALAAYLATVARALKDKLQRLKEPEKLSALERQTLTVDKDEHTGNLNGTIVAEILVVVLAVAVVIRIFLRPFTSDGTVTTVTGNITTVAKFPVWIDFFDVFLLSFFMSVGFFLAFLHGRQWRHQSPDTATAAITREGAVRPPPPAVETDSQGT
jgi:hypothetical protein